MRKNPKGVRQVFQASGGALAPLDVLVDHKQELSERLWAVVTKPEQERESQRLRAACALAICDPDSPHWDQAGGAVMDQLVAENPVHLGLWLDGFRPVKARFSVMEVRPVRFGGTNATPVLFSRRCSSKNGNGPEDG